MDLSNERSEILIVGIHPYFLEKISHLPKEKCFLFNFEPHVMWPGLYDKSLTRYFGKIFVMFDDIVDNQNYFKFCFPQPSQAMLQKTPDFSEKRLCALINTNKASPVNHPKELFTERRGVISFFESGHKRGRLFIVRRNESHGGFPDGIKKGEVLLARNAEYILNARRFKTFRK